MKLRTLTVACLLVLAGTVPAPAAESADDDDRKILMAGIDDVSNPRLIEESKVDPVYPEKAREKRKTGEVTLQAVIEIDGSVSELKAIRSTRPGFGFEKSALEAVKQWRYEPARKDGEPVPVYFTVVVNFSLR